ncbi:MAG: protein translocase subunit SecF [Cellulosilyticaceae bacterium]
MNIIKNRKKYYILSLVLIVVGMLAMPFFGMQGQGILNYHVEFKGGSVMQIDMGKDVDVETEIMPIIDTMIKDSGARIQKVANSNEIIITTKPIEDTERAALFDKLKETYELEDQALLKDEFVSPTISGEFKAKAIGAVGIGAILMLIYITIRFKDFKFGASAVIALLHNVLIMLGVYALFRIPINNSFIAAMLTIVGYSINDTIIIFDRIRENKGKMRGTDEEVINASVKQTITRSINTSITTVVMVLLLLIIGTDSVKEFAFPLAIGILAGTYSSIFIASPLWYEMRKFQRNSKEKTLNSKN